MTEVCQSPQYRMISCSIQIPTLYDAFQSVKHPKSAPFPRGGICTRSNTWFLGPIQLRIPNYISIGSAVYAQLTAHSPCIILYVPSNVLATRK